MFYIQNNYHSWRTLQFSSVHISAKFLDPQAAPLVGFVTNYAVAIVCMYICKAPELLDKEFECFPGKIGPKFW